MTIKIKGREKKAIKKWLQKLDHYLQALKPEDSKDILDNYNELIYDKVFNEQLTVAMVLSTMTPIDDIATDVYNELLGKTPHLKIKKKFLKLKY